MRRADVGVAVAREALARLRVRLPRGATLRDLARGMRVELEHRDVTRADPLLTARIALAHLRERPDYYQLLARLERAPRRRNPAMHESHRVVSVKRPWVRYDKHTLTWSDGGARGLVLEYDPLGVGALFSDGLAYVDPVTPAVTVYRDDRSFLIHLEVARDGSRVWVEDDALRLIGVANYERLLRMIARVRELATTTARAKPRRRRPGKR